MIGRRIAYLVGLCGVVLFLICYTAYLSMFVLLFWLAIPVVSLLLFLPVRRRVSYRLRTKEGTVQRGETAMFWLDLQCNTRLPIGPVRVCWQCENRLTGERFRQVVTFPAERGQQRLALSAAVPYCGQVICTVRQARVCDLLGLFSSSCGKRQQESLYVLPPVEPIALAARPLPEESADGAEYDPYRPGNDQSEPFGLREYRPGDPVRSIHWKLTEKRDELLVREGSRPLPAGPDLVLELLQAEPRVLDCAVETVLLLSSAFLEQGIRHRMLWYDHGLQAVSVEDADTQAEAISGLFGAAPHTSALAAASLEGDRPLFYVTTGNPMDSPLPEKAVVLACGSEKAEEKTAHVVPVRPGHVAANLEGLAW